MCCWERPGTKCRVTFEQLKRLFLWWIMTSRAIDSLETVELVMLLEEIFGTDIPDNAAEGFGSPHEIVDLLNLHLFDSRPNDQAVALLKKLAKVPRSSRIGRGPRRTMAA